MQKIKKNDPCPCGSGKKYVKCCINKKPREQYIYIAGKEPFKGIKYENGKISLILPSDKIIDAEQYFFQTQYKSENGKEKTINRIPDCATFDISNYLYSNFDVICAIDTNTRVINNNSVSIASVFECHKDPNIRQFTINKCGNIFFKNFTNNESEKHSLVKLINLLNRNPYYKNKKTAIITDHDRDNHNKFNERELPLLREFYLPDNCTIVYANSDKKKESILNFLIASCDKDAKNLLDQLSEKGILEINGTQITVDNIPEPKNQ
ncbi:SEC-C domain-containing protein [Candidatus Poribacteria bacterium]|nr:SEC-C domain-containing protein [Candidatus Poribacteria bacterium]